MSAPTRTWTFRCALTCVLLSAAAGIGACTPASEAPDTSEGLAAGEYSLWSDATTPSNGSSPDSQPAELGTRVRVDVDGVATAIRFYKSRANTGAHTGSLWSADGTRLATLSFAGETASGWQTARFATPVALRAGASYVVSYHTDVGRYVRTVGYFDGRSVDRGPLHAPASTAAAPNGVFRTGASGFPTQSRQAANYWVDLVFRPADAADAGTVTDAASGTDAGAVTDAASGTDAGTASDASSGSDTGTATDAGAGPTPTIDEQFGGWSGTVSPDGVWRIAGVWTGTGGNVLDPANARFVSSFMGESGSFLTLTSKANVLRGAEIQTLPTYGYGYYETRMRVANVRGVVNSFFWIQGGQTSYGPREWDVEILPNDYSLTGSTGIVRFTVHQVGGGQQFYLQPVDFNPSQGFHRYGFLWTPGRIDFTADGAIVRSFTDASLSTTERGVIMMNSWTGNPDFGGGPPTEDATAAYDWVKFYAGATSVVR